MIIVYVLFYRFWSKWFRNKTTRSQAYIIICFWILFIDAFRLKLVNLFHIYSHGLFQSNNYIKKYLDILLWESQFVFFLFFFLIRLLKYNLIGSRI